VARAPRTERLESRSTRDCFKLFLALFLIDIASAPYSDDQRAAMIRNPPGGSIEIVGRPFSGISFDNHAPGADTSGPDDRSTAGFGRRSRQT